MKGLNKMTRKEILNMIESINQTVLYESEKSIEVKPYSTYGGIVFDFDENGILTSIDTFE